MIKNFVIGTIIIIIVIFSIIVVIFLLENLAKNENHSRHVSCQNSFACQKLALS